MANGWRSLLRVTYPQIYKRPIRIVHHSLVRNRVNRPYHLIPLALGGSPTSPANLWPEPHLGPGQWGSYAKDRLEARLARLVCAHRLGLDEARRMIARDWISAYRRFIGARPDNAPLHGRGAGYDGGYRPYDHWHRWHHWHRRDW